MIFVFIASQNELTILDLRRVFNNLRNGGFSYHNYFDLGLELGLYNITLDIIRADNPDVESCLMECISKWLQRADDVNERGGTNWTTLCNAVEKINRATADYIS